MRILDTVSRNDQLKRRRILWMPLDCAKRGKFPFVSDLPDAPRGLSTAFQQLLWKTGMMGISRNEMCARGIYRGFTFVRSLSRKTNLSPDHTSSTAHILTSTSPAAS